MSVNFAIDSRLSQQERIKTFPLQSPDQLEIFPTKDPEMLLLQPIRSYNYLNESSGRINWYNLTTVQKNFQKIKKTPNAYYLNSGNPFVVVIEKDSYGNIMQYIWKSIDSCDGGNIKELSLFLTDADQSVNINCGTHGDQLGNTVSDMFTIEKSRIDSFARVTNQFYLEDIISSRCVPGRISVNHMSTKHRPTYPERANHNIYGWCFSFSSLFTSQQRYFHPIDNRGNHLAPIFKCVTSQKMLDNPRYYSGCIKINEERHYYDLRAVEKLITQNKNRIDSRSVLDRVHRASSGLINGLRSRSSSLLIHNRSQSPELDSWRNRFYCRLEGCRALINFKELRRDKAFEGVLNEYKDSLVDIQHKDVEVHRLQQTVEGQSEEIVELKGRVKVVTSEREYQKQKKIHYKHEWGVVSQDKDVLAIENQELRLELNRVRNLQASFEIRERISFMGLGDFSIPSSIPEFVENAKRRIAITNSLLKELKNFRGLLTQGWVYQPTPFIKKGETQSEEFFEAHVHDFRRYIAEVVRPPYNILVQEASSHLLFNLDREAPLYKDILTITYETPLIKVQRNLKSTELLWRELENTLDTVHTDFYSILKENHLWLKTPTRQDYHVVSSQIIRYQPEVNWDQQEKDMTEIAVIGSKTYATKLSEILSRLMAIRWCEGNNAMLNQFLNERI